MQQYVLVARRKVTMLLKATTQICSFCKTLACNIANLDISTYSDISPKWTIFSICTYLKAHF